MPEDDSPGRYQIDADFIVTAWDYDAERHLGWTAADAIGQLVFQFMPIRVAGWAQRIATLQRCGSYAGVDNFVTKAGEVVTVAAAAAAMCDEAGRVVGYSCAICPQAGGKPVQRRGTVATATDSAESNGRPEPPTLERLYTLDEAARLLRKSTRTVRRLLHDGKLAGEKVGGTWRIAESELARVTGRVARGGSDWSAPVILDE